MSSRWMSIGCAICAPEERELIGWYVAACAEVGLETVDTDSEHVVRGPTPTWEHGMPYTWGECTEHASPSAKRP